MARESRTQKQIVANQLDLEAFNLAEKVARYAETYNLPEWKEAALVIARQRSAFRKHMHPGDRKGTEG